VSDPVRQDIAESLHAIQSQRHRVARRVASPKGYHLALGLLIGVMVGSLESRSVVVVLAAYLIMTIGFGVLIGVYRQTTGLWVNGWRRSPAGRWTVGLVAGLALLVGLAAGLEFGLGWRGPFVVAGALSVLWSTLAGRRFDRALRSEVLVER